MRIESGYSVSPAYARSQSTVSARENTELKGKGKTTESDEATAKADSSQATGNPEAQLSEEEKKQVAELKKADRQIKQHEMAHMAAAAGIAVSGAQFEYKRGPDGVMYAVAGEVNIDTSPVSGDPQATLAKAQKIERAAMAPVDPSPQDRKVAAQARQMAVKARMEMMQQAHESSGLAATDPSKDQEPYEQGSYIDVTA